ncbi:hypothetical protein Athena1_0019 [Vibrio phage Athena1]|nr:hypothetical protein Athena1_0019 [Vibrio phage Athena1]
MKADRREEILNRVESKCEIAEMGFILDGKPSPCHIWQGGDSGKGTGAGRGYGRMSLGGQTVAVHLVVYTHYYGYIPGKKTIDHLCNNRLCCNPAHLEMVSHKENCKRRNLRKLKK